MTVASKPVTGNKLGITRFNVDNIKPNRAFLCVGKKGCGKSTMVYQIAQMIAEKVDISIAMVRTFSSQREFEEMLTKAFVYTEFRGDVLQNLLDYQLKCQQQGHPLRRVALFLDDLAYDKGIFKTKVMRELLMNGRHLEITVVLSLQYCMDMGPDMRSQIDYVFAFSEKIGKNRKRLYENFFGMFHTYEGFEKAFFKCTQNFECLAMDNTSNSNDLNQIVFHFKAALKEDVPKFTMINPVFTALSKHFEVAAPHAAAEEEETATQISKITEVFKVAPDAPARKKKSKRPTVQPLYVDAA